MARVFTQEELPHWASTRDTRDRLDLVSEHVPGSATRLKSDRVVCHAGDQAAARRHLGGASFQAPLPGLNARRFAAQILLKGNRPIACPDSTRASEIRNTRLRADSRAREHDNLTTSPDSCSKFIHRDHGAFIEQSAL